MMRIGPVKKDINVSEWLLTMTTSRQNAITTLRTYEMSGR